MSNIKKKFCSLFNKNKMDTDILKSILPCSRKKNKYSVMKRQLMEAMDLKYKSESCSDIKEKKLFKNWYVLP